MAAKAVSVATDDPIERQLSGLCVEFTVDDDTKQEARQLLQKFYEQHSSGQEHEQLWPVCALYVISIKAVDTTAPAGVPLSQMLQFCNTRLYDFFAPLRLFIDTLHLDRKVLENLEYKYIVVTVLFEKYEQLYCKLFKCPNSSTDKVFRLGWLLFLLAKGKLLEAPGDLVQSLHLLICCLNLLVLHVPESSRLVPIKDMLNFAREKMGLEEADSLLYLCCMSHANYAHVKNLQDHLFHAWLTGLCDNQILRYHPAKIPPDGAGTFYWGGLLDTNLNENEKSLNNEYEVMLYESCDFNERLLLERNGQLQSPMRPPPQQPFLRTPRSTPLTPARALLSTDDWLVKTLAHISAEPPPGLKVFVPAQEADAVIEALRSRVQSLLTLFKFTTSDQERKSTATKLFYRTLDVLLASEAKRLKRNDFKALLVNEVFVKSLLACCVEVIIYVYGINPTVMRFPWILQTFDIVPFDFYTIIESVVMHQPEPKLPRLVVKHLIDIEERILEELAWQDTSAVYQALSNPQHNEMLMAQLQTMSLTTISTPKKKGPVQILASPRATPSAPPSPSPHMAALSSICPPPSPASIGKSTANSNAERISKKVEVFIRKVAYMASLRIQELCREFSMNLQSDGNNPPTPPINDKVMHQIEHVMLHILTQKPTLVCNRHIDQLLLCTFYGVCKVNKIHVSFKDIIDKYMRQPQANPQTYYKVRVSKEEAKTTNTNGQNGEKQPTPSASTASTDTTVVPVTVDIIGFYNSVFLEAMESVLMELDTDGDGGVKTLRTSKPLFDLRTASPLNLRVHKSPQKIRTLMVSPRRTPLLLRDRANTRSVVLGAPGESPRRDFSRINDCLNAPPSKSRANAKRQLNFEMPSPTSSSTTTTTASLQPSAFFSSPGGHAEVPTADESSEISDMVVDNDEEAIKRGIKRKQSEIANSRGSPATNQNKKPAR